MNETKEYTLKNYEELNGKIYATSSEEVLQFFNHYVGILNGLGAPTKNWTIGLEDYIHDERESMRVVREKYRNTIKGMQLFYVCVPVTVAIESMAMIKQRFERPLYLSAEYPNSNWVYLVAF